MRAALAVLLGLLLVGALAGLIERVARWLVRQWPIILVVAMALVLAGCAMRPRVVIDWQTRALRAEAALDTIYDLLHTAAGLTAWDCRYKKPRGWVPLDYADTLRVRKHEDKHVTQALTFGCEEWNRRRLEQAFRDSIEDDAWAR